MKFIINNASPVRNFVRGIRVAAATYRVAANLVDLAARGVEAVTSPEALKTLAGHLAEATTPLEGVAPGVGDRTAREAAIEAGLRMDIHGDETAAARASRLRNAAQAAWEAAADAAAEAGTRAAEAESAEAAAGVRRCAKAKAPKAKAKAKAQTQDWH